MKNTKIQWTDASWNCLRGCSRVSKGCEHCYAEQVAHRFSGPGLPYEGLITVNQSTGEPRWNGEVMLVEEHLLDPLRWQKPRMIFVNSMSDVFHEAVPDEYIDKMFAVMALAPQHTFQLLTKRPERMRAYLSSYDRREQIQRAGNLLSSSIVVLHTHILQNVWLGVSVEDQKTADDRIPILLQTPAAVRWISAEPLLGPVDIDRIYLPDSVTSDIPWLMGRMVAPSGYHKPSRNPHGAVSVPVFDKMLGIKPNEYRNLDWVVVGGESGPKARPFNVEWARSIVTQCKDAEVACFVKQLGGNVRDRNDAGFHGEEGDAWDIGGDLDAVEHDPDGIRYDYQGAEVRIHLTDRKGGNMEEWPEDLRVREYPMSEVEA